MMTALPTEGLIDSDLWQLVLRGDVHAFEAVVKRHQSLVFAVAYNACGNLSLSEDVAQETFWAAWRERASLGQPSRLRPWLCGIARNIGRNFGRRTSRPVESATELAGLKEPTSDEPNPSDEAVSREEENLIWEALGHVSESYREALILFYREDHSVAEVASALGISEDATKQRLSRGRAMLRDKMTERVEKGLRRMKPGRSFAIAVMTGLTASTKTSLAAGGVVTSTGVGASTLVGSLLGSVVGLTGGWLGTWIPAQLARTKQERDTLLKAGRRILPISLVFVAALYGLARAFAGRPGYLIAWGAWFVAFQGYFVWVTIRLSRAIKRIRAEVAPMTEPNDTPLFLRSQAIAARYRGRVFRSRATLLGLPILDINVSDPSTSQRRVARGWIAIGNEARGILLAIGSIRAVGIVALGGCSLGVVALGGVSIGGLSLGGLGIGVFAIGGVAIGGWACGGAAIAWKFASGGCAIARYAAYGGASIAHDFAVGGGGHAQHFNDDVARAILMDHPLKQGIDWYIGHSGVSIAVILVFTLLLTLAVLPVMYRRDRPL